MRSCLGRLEGVWHPTWLVEKQIQLETFSYSGSQCQHNIHVPSPRPTASLTVSTTDIVGVSNIRSFFGTFVGQFRAGQHSCIQSPSKLQNEMQSEAVGLTLIRVYEQMQQTLPHDASSPSLTRSVNRQTDTTHHIYCIRSRPVVRLWGI